MGSKDLDLISLTSSETSCSHINAVSRGSLDTLIKGTPTSVKRDLFSLDDDSGSSRNMSGNRRLNSLEEAVDCYSLGKFIRGQSNKRRRVEEEPLEDLRPIAYVRFNTRVGKPKPITIKALLDSGGGGTLVTKQIAKKLKIKQTKSEQVWTTPGSSLETSAKVKAQFTIPKLHDRRLIEWDAHVTASLGSYDMIIG